MAISVNLGGVGYSVPEPGDSQWAANATAYLVALATAFPQIGGQVGFTALTSATANPATAGQLRLANSDGIDWRNAGNTANAALGIGNVGNGLAAGELAFFNPAGTGNLLSGQPLAVYQTNAAQSIPNAAFTVVNFGSVVTDTDNAVTTGASWHFTVPLGKGGHYAIAANVRFQGLTANTGTFNLSVFVNGSVSCTGASVDTSNGPTQGVSVATVLNCAAGQSLDIRVFQQNGAARSLSTVFVENSVSIKRLV